MNALGLVTAAGKSTRMGGYPKPLLRFGDERFVERILRCYAEAGVGHRLVVLGHEAETVRERAEFGDADVVVNEAYESGMLSSVQCGVREALDSGVDGLFLWPTDYPCAPSAVVERLWETYEDTDADVVIPTFEGDRGHPALFGATTFEDLLDAPENEGARAVVYDEGTTVVDLETGDRRILVDIDTPSEYWDAVKRYGGPNA